MRLSIGLIALMVAATPALAQTAGVASKSIAANATTAVATATPVAANRGQLLVSADHARLGSVVRVDVDGSVGIIFDSQMVTIPVSTLKMADGKLTTSLSKHQIAALQ